jgi:hypothetical protein
MGFLSCSANKKSIMTEEISEGSFDEDGDGISSEMDCNDQDPTISPIAEEICDGIDNNCNDEIDEDLLLEWFLDDDEDGFGIIEESIFTCTEPSGYVDNGDDCDDTEESIHPEAPEQCDELDNNCDGNIDEDVTEEWFLDADEDGFGDPSDSLLECIKPEGYVGNSDDCDDEYDMVYPEAPEQCDELDNDCDGETDEEVGDIWFLDADGDGFGDDSTQTQSCSFPEGYVSTGDDCDDIDSFVNPIATEYCDYLDNNCDGNIDENSAQDASTWYADTDADGYGALSAPTRSCELPIGYVSDNTDCDDNRALSSPIGIELCNGFDDNCNTYIDEDSAQDAQDWYSDADADGYGFTSNTLHQCAQPVGYILDNTDCDDNRALSSPIGIELCNGFDDNCDTYIDENSAQDALTWYADTDADNYGDASQTQLSCDQPTGYVFDNTDCNDGNIDINPIAPEVCDNIDNDCDALIDDDDPNTVSFTNNYYLDGDGDGYGTGTSLQACSPPNGYVDDNSDCDDGNASVSPGNSEQCGNTLDDNCDGSYSENCPTSYIGCGGPGTLQPGVSMGCSFGGTVYVDTVRVAGGCNDGESGTYTITFDDGSSTVISGGCGATQSISPRFVSSATLYMNGGGGGDGNISWTCCGSSGWGIYHR